MERQCWCQPINQRHLKVSLSPLDTPKSYDSTEDEQRWRNIGKVQPSSNNTSHGPQIVNVDPSRMFDFDPNAIQVMDDMEFEHLPEAVNREILKNSQEIIFEDEEEASRRAPIKLYDERSKTLRSSREIIFEEEEENILTRKSLERIKLNTRDTSKIYKEEKLPLMKVEENHEDVANILQVHGGRYKIKNKKNYRMYLEKRLGMQDHIVPISQDQKIDSFLNEKQKFLRKLNRNRRDDAFVTNNGRFSNEPGRNATDQLIVSLNQDQRNSKTNLSLNEKQKPSMKLSTHLIDDSFATNDGVSFRVSKRNAFNMKNYEMYLEERLDSSLNRKENSVNDKKTFERQEKNVIDNMRYIKMLEEGNKSLIESSSQRPNYDFSERENSHRMERCDKFKIESEKRKPTSRLAKIIIQRKLHPADFQSLVSPFSDLSPESGFYEGNFSISSPECGRKEPHLLPRNKFEDVNEVKEDSSSSQRNILGGVGVPKERVQVPIIEESRHVCDNIQIVDGSETSSHSNFSRRCFIDEDDISVKCVKSPIIEISSCVSDNIDSVDENRVSSDSNLSYKHFFYEDHSALKCLEVPLDRIDNNIHDVKHKVSSDYALSPKHFVHDDNNTEDLDIRLSKNDQRFVEDNDDDIIKCANVSASKEKITCMDNEIQDINGSAKKRNFPSVSRKLFNNFNDSDEQNCCSMLAKTNNKL